MHMRILLALVATTAIGSIVDNNRLLGRHNSPDPAGCTGFFDLNFDRFNFDEYSDYFDENSTFTLHAAGTYWGPDGIEEYVRFASDTSIFIDSTRRLQGGLPIFKGVNSAGECVFNVFTQSMYELSPRYSNGETWRVASMLTIVYARTTHKVAAIMLYYDPAFIQDIFSASRGRRTAEYLCNIMKNECVGAGVHVWSHNNFAGFEDCISRFEQLDTFDDGDQLAASNGAGGVDGNSAGCRMLHGTLAALNPAGHCAHLSFVPMADNLGRIKCQQSNRYQVSDFFDPIDFLNFDQFKEAVKISEARGYEATDECHYPDNFRVVVPRPYWDAWRESNEEQIVPPLEYVGDEGFMWLTTYATWVAVVILGLGSEGVVGTILTEYLSSASLQHFWHGAQCVFPLFVQIGIVSRSYFGLVLMTLGLWKCGSPETLVYFMMARNPRLPLMYRLECALNGAGTLIHHSATSFLCVCLVTGRELLDRNVLTCTLPLVIQHWLVLTKYASLNFYIASVCIVEVVWEWEVLWNLATYPCHGWNILMIASLMLVAHWLYMAAAVVSLLCSKSKHLEPNHTVSNILAHGEKLRDNDDQNDQEGQGHASTVSPRCRRGSVLGALGDLELPLHQKKKAVAFSSPSFGDGRASEVDRTSISAPKERKMKRQGTSMLWQQTLNERSSRTSTNERSSQSSMTNLHLGSSTKKDLQPEIV